MNGKTNWFAILSPTAYNSEWGCDPDPDPEPLDFVYDAHLQSKWCWASNAASRIENRCILKTLHKTLSIAKG
jgi:hypothetical protein